MSTTRTSRQTKLPVTVARFDEVGLDDDGGRTRWYTICELHGQCVGHSSKAAATGFAAEPMTWCEVCNGNDELSEEDAAMYRSIFEEQS
jgi:hypothetical protein